MRSKVLVPVVLLSLGIFSTTTFFGCSSDSPKGSGTGGKGAATGGKGGSGGSGAGGSATGGTGTGGSGSGGSDSGGAGGTLATGGAVGGGTAGAAGSNVGGAAGNAATGGVGGSGMTGGRGGIAGVGGAAGSAVGGAAGSAVGGAGGGAPWPQTLAACMNYPTVSVTDFCAYYTTTCGDMYSAATGHFASAVDCATKYTAYTPTQKMCATYHLCAAGTPNAANAHCLHPAGGSGNPCSL